MCKQHHSQLPYGICAEIRSIFAHGLPEHLTILISQALLQATALLRINSFCLQNILLVVCNVKSLAIQVHFLNQIRHLTTKVYTGVPAIYWLYYIYIYNTCHHVSVHLSTYSTLVILYATTPRTHKYALEYLFYDLDVERAKQSLARTGFEPLNQISYFFPAEVASHQLRQIYIQSFHCSVPFKCHINQFYTM